MFERNFDSVTIDGLKGDGLFTGKLEPNIRSGTVFPVMRAGCVEFYHKGGKLFSYAKEFSTHKKYASVIEKTACATSCTPYYYYCVCNKLHTLLLLQK